MYVRCITVPGYGGIQMPRPVSTIGIQPLICAQGSTIAAEQAYARDNIRSDVWNEVLIRYGPSSPAEVLVHEYCCNIGDVRVQLDRHVLATGQWVRIQFNGELPQVCAVFYRTGPAHDQVAATMIRTPTTPLLPMLMPQDGTSLHQATPPNGQPQGATSGQQYPALPSSGQQHPARSSSGQQHPAGQSYGQQNTALPSSGQQHPARPSSGQQHPARSSSGQQHPARPSSGQQHVAGTALPSSGQQNTARPSSGQQQQATTAGPSSPWGLGVDPFETDDEIFENGFIAALSIN